MDATHFYSLNQPPEEEALNAALQYAKNSDLTEQNARLFGRNIYPTDKPEPHGYEYLITTDNNKPGSTEEKDVVSGGLYAMQEIKGLFGLAEGWKGLMDWAAANGYMAVGVKKGPHGWVNSAYEELLDWAQQKPPEEWRFRLWLQLRE
ncbi:hypothetical protein GX563_07265 [Candidatus Bathyarchaeota archaeon]|nr:hypothetical protein [Candidatus Bathyarchaeota archaeon]